MHDGLMRKLFPSSATQSGDTAAQKALQRSGKVAVPAAPASLNQSYETVKVIRQTLQGKVVHMRSRRTHEDVAVKIALKQFVDSKRSSNGAPIAEDICAEIAMLKMLSREPCANVVQLVDHFEDRDQHALIMQLAGGGELFDWVERHGSIDERKARQMLGGIAHGVAFMHGKGICHLDLSLENVLLADDNTPMICDLGLARYYRRGQQFPGSATRRPGKLSYMSPEIFAGNDFHGDAADVWSLGIILFIVLFGFPPFEVASASDVRYAFMQRHGLGRLLAEWKLANHISEAALDLLGSIFQAESSRITLDQVLRHPWMTG